MVLIGKPSFESPPTTHEVAAKIDAEVLRLARIVAAYRDQSVAEYLSDRLRPLVEADHAEEIRRITERTEDSTRPRRKPNPD